MTLNLRQIEVFRAVMLTGSISGAARLLAVSQPAVSRLLAYTEDRLGLPLFERTKGRLHPTPEARRLFEEVDAVYQGVQRVNEMAQSLLTRSTGTVRLVASPSLGQSLVPQALSLFRDRHPDVRIEYQVLTINELIRQVASNQVDIGLSVLPVEHPNIVATAIGAGRLVCVCRKEHKLAALPMVRAADLVPYPLIGYGADSPYGQIVNRFLGRSAQDVRITVQVRFSPMACALVQAGVGIAIADEFVVMGRTWPDLAPRPLTPKVTMRGYLLTPRDAPMSQLARHLSVVLRSLLPSPPRQSPAGEEADPHP